MRIKLSSVDDVFYRYVVCPMLFFFFKCTKYECSYWVLPLLNFPSICSVASTLHHTTMNLMQVISEACFCFVKWDLTHIPSASTALSVGFIQVLRQGSLRSKSICCDGAQLWLAQRAMCLSVLFCPATGSGVLACFIDLSPLGAGARLLCDRVIWGASIYWCFNPLNRMLCMCMSVCVC